MARQVSEQPTEVELQILDVLWDLGEGTARQVHDALLDERGTTYSTTVKMLKIMTEKGLVRRDDSVRPQLFKPSMSREKTGLRMIRDLVDKVYQGSSIALAMHALSSGRASEEELRQIRGLLNEMEKKK
jgi:BlaI family penicillinase repressor